MDQGQSETQLVCPYCMTTLPQLSFLPVKNGQLELKVKCKCTSEDKVIGLNQFIRGLSCLQVGKHLCSNHKKEAKKYCIKCSAWLCDYCKDHSNHLLCPYEMKLTCSQHNKCFSLYCELCNENCCAECQSLHIGHQMVTLSQVKSMEELQMNVVNDFKAKNRELTKALISRIDQEMKKLEQMKEDIQSACDSNEAINEGLRQLHQRIRKTLSALKDYPSYEMIKLQGIVINTETFPKIQRSIEGEFEVLKEHLQKNVLLMLSEEKEVKLTSVQIGNDNQDFDAFQPAAPIKSDQVPPMNNFEMSNQMYESPQPMSNFSQPKPMSIFAPPMNSNQLQIQMNPQSQISDLPLNAYEELFIGNLTPNTTEQTIFTTMSKYGFVKNVKVLKDHNTNQSKGVGFVEFHNKRSAVNAINNAGNIIIDGQVINVCYSNDKSPSQSQVFAWPIDQSQLQRSSNQPREKHSIFVGNLNFKTTEETIRKCFSDCGNVLQVRIAQSDGRSKGYAHVDFQTEQAVNEALKKNGFELEGRLLRIDNVSKQGGGGFNQREGRGGFNR